MDDLRLGGVLLQRAELAALGVSDRVIATKRRHGELQTLRRGRYADSNDANELDGRERHALDVRAALTRVKPGAHASRESAALLLGGSVFGHPGVVHLVRDNARPARYPGLIVDQAAVPAHHCCTVDGVPSTSGARTVVDVARSRPLPQALVVADSLLRVGACQGEELLAVLGECGRWRGARAAGVVVRYADSRAENAFESYSRGIMILHGVEVPELQAWVQGADGRWYRVDFYWRRHRLIGEADGRIKYKEGRDLLEEKRRQETLSQAGENFIRWDWPEAVYQDARLARRIDRRLTELS